MNETKVMAFGMITDIIGKNNIVLKDVSSTNDLKARLEQQYPRLKDINYAIAVNKKMVVESVRIEENGTIALLPPFSGG